MKYIAHLYCIDICKTQYIYIKKKQKIFENTNVQMMRMCTFINVYLLRFYS